MGIGGADKGGDSIGGVSGGEVPKRGTSESHEYTVIPLDVLTAGKQTVFA